MPKNGLIKKSPSSLLHIYLWSTVVAVLIQPNMPHLICPRSSWLAAFTMSFASVLMIQRRVKNKAHQPFLSSIKFAIFSLIFMALFFSHIQYPTKSHGMEDLVLISYFFPHHIERKTELKFLFSTHDDRHLFSKAVSICYAIINEQWNGFVDTTSRWS